MKGYIYNINNPDIGKLVKKDQRKKWIYSSLYWW